MHPSAIVEAVETVPNKDLFLQTTGGALLTLFWMRHSVSLRHVHKDGYNVQRLAFSFRQLLNLLL